MYIGIKKLISKFSGNNTESTHDKEESADTEASDSEEDDTSPVEETAAEEDTPPAREGEENTSLGDDADHKEDIEDRNTRSAEENVVVLLHNPEVEETYL